MKHKLLAVFSAVVMGCLCAGLTACGGPKHVHTFTVDNVCSECGEKWEYTEGLEYNFNPQWDSYYVKGIGTASGNIVIPYGHEGKPVTAVWYNAFSSSDLTGITLPDSITYIGSSAFFRCNGLKSVTIPRSVTSVLDSAFGECENLEEITWNAEQIDAYALSHLTFGIFVRCEKLKTVTFGDDYREVPYGIFTECPNIKKITIPDSVTSIDSYSFYDTAYFDNAKNWDESGVLYINNHLIAAKKDFSGTYTVRTGTKTIADDAFQKTELTGIIIPNGVVAIGQSAFASCEHLSDELKLPESLETIGNGAFRGCINLSGELKLPKNLKSIENAAFFGCAGLSGELELPRSLELIGQRAFDECSGITGFRFDGTIEAWRAIQKTFDWSGYQSGRVVTCTDGTVSTFDNGAT